MFPNISFHLQHLHPCGLVQLQLVNNLHSHFLTSEHMPERVVVVVVSGYESSTKRWHLASLTTA